MGLLPYFCLFFCSFSSAFTGFHHPKIDFYFLPPPKSSQAMPLNRYYRKMLSPIASDLVVAKWANGKFNATNATIYVPDEERILANTEKEPHSYSIYLRTNLSSAAEEEGPSTPTIPCLECVKNEHGLLFLAGTGISNELFKQLALKPGRNKARLSFVKAADGKAPLEIEMNIYLCDELDKMVISDIDGTITRSDKRGLVLPIFGMNWAQKGVAELYSALVANGYRLAYLSSRPIPLLNETAEYLQQLKLPEGPIFLTPQGLKVTLTNLNSVLKPIPFKKTVLRQLKEIFPAQSDAIIAGIGNQETDIDVYRAFSFRRAFIVDEAGSVCIYERGQKLERITNYTEMNEQVDMWFPKLVHKCSCNSLDCSEV